MNQKRIFRSFKSISLGVALSLIMLASSASGMPNTGIASEAPELDQEIRQPGSIDELPLRFPSGNWPWYAQDEILITPEPPMPDAPVEFCVEVVNDDPLGSHTAMLQFSVAPLGFGVPYQLIDERELVVPAAQAASTCVVWIPPGPGLWGFEVLLFQDGAQEPLRSLRNIDFWEPLVPGEPHDLFLPVGPLGDAGEVTFEITHILPGWTVEVIPSSLIVQDPTQVYLVMLRTTPPLQAELGSFVPVAEIEAFLDRVSIGGVLKLDSPAVPLHNRMDPSYAESEISIDPYPVIAGMPTEICVLLRNPTPYDQEVNATFYWANFGIGLPFSMIADTIPVSLPPYSLVKTCIHWVPPMFGHLCLQVELNSVDYWTQFSQRNLDVNEPLKPGIPDDLIIQVGNPSGAVANISLGLIPKLPGWGLELYPDILSEMKPGEVRPVTLTVVPPIYQDLPPDNTPIVDVEAFIDDLMIGGIRKVFRPPVPIHHPGDPIYAEREIFVRPYPPRAGEPTEISVELRNPTDQPQTVSVVFKWSAFGIGLPFAAIGAPQEVLLPPYSIVKDSIMWVPPFGGLFCVQVDILIDGYSEPFYSQLNLDVGEPLEPLVPHERIFEVGNPLQEPATITLGMIPYLDGWGLSLTPDVLLNVLPGEIRPVVLKVTPPEVLPPDGAPIVDVEAFANGELIGGFRKIFRPPVPIHRPGDPIYAESEIGVDPYPAIPGMPVTLSVEVFNPTDTDEIVTATFSVAAFGIGLPFDTAYVVPNPIQIFVPANGAARGFVVWEPPDWSGKFCVKVVLEMDGHEPIWSQRNIDVGEPLQPGVSHDLVFEVGIGDLAEESTVTLGLVPHKDGWQFSLSKDVLLNVKPGQLVPVTLTVIPPVDAALGTGEPIVDVEAYVDGILIGGFRKVDIPPVPLHKPNEKGYSESEIMIEPYPPQEGQTTTVSAAIQNASDTPIEVELRFGWADFGMGIPFDSDGMSPASKTVTVAAESSQTVSVDWTPVQSGHQCVIVKLQDTAKIYEPQESQRNVDVLESPTCGTEKIYTFTLMNNTAQQVTVDLGLITFNVPVDWVVTTVPSGSVVVSPFSELVVEVHVFIPCAATLRDLQQHLFVSALQDIAGGTPVIDVEGYVEGELIGGIELQFEDGVELQLYLPYVHR